RFNIPVEDSQLEDLPFFRPAEDNAEMRYLMKCREKLGGHLPQRRDKSFSIPTPPLETLKAVLDGSGERESSMTMAFGRILSQLIKDKDLGKRIGPIYADETRIFVMEVMFRRLSIYAPAGQLYEPVDRDQVMNSSDDK